MRPSLFSLIAAVLFCTISAVSQTVIERDSSVSIDGSFAVVHLVVDSDLEQVAVPTSIELVDAADKVCCRADGGSINLSKGRQTTEFRLPMAALLESKNNDLPWVRLSYSIGNARGIVSLSQLIPDLFEMRVIAGEYLLAGSSYRVRVRATHPFTGEPAAGVQTTVKVRFDLKGDDARKLDLNSSAVTDADGFAVADFTVPADALLDHEEDGEVEVLGTKNGIVRTASRSLSSPGRMASFLALSDKPIYQPEQLLNLRGILMVGSEGKTVLGDSEIEFRVSDEDETILYREKVRTSSFGIAAMSWPIPANARLGQYRVDVRDSDGERIGGVIVRVSRYDLPNFTVNAVTDKTYYLPGENEARIDVNADYLFGRPVAKGKIRIVEETSREWDWKNQKYNIEEGQVRQGDTDGSGRFSTTVDLTKAHADLKDSDWRKYRDVRFAAYFTDTSTNRTEQRRFDVRVTNEPIHVYVSTPQYSIDPSLPMVVYFSTFYADGKPAACDLDVRASVEDEDKFRTVARLKTNKFGVGKLSMMRPSIGSPDDDLDLSVAARDNAGRKGTAHEQQHFDPDRDGIQIETGKTIYRPGETIEVHVRSTVQSGPVYFDVLTDGGSVIQSGFGVLRNGRAEMAIPYSSAFSGQLKIGVFAENHDKEVVATASGVIFPSHQGISVDAAFDKAVYKPGEDASVKFSVVDAVGSAIQSALGIVVVDRAVEERARSDEEFGRWWSGYADWLGYGTSIGAVNVKDLVDLDVTKPIDDDLQIVGEVMLSSQYYYPTVERSDDLQSDAKRIFAGHISAQFEPVVKALNDAYSNDGFRHPTDESTLADILERRGIHFENVRDPWGTRYAAKFSVDKTYDVVNIVSAAPDKAFGTADDFDAFTTRFEYFTPTGKAINAAFEAHKDRTGSFIRDSRTLLTELGLTQIQDRFGRPYHFDFGVDRRYFTLVVKSAGPDGKLEDTGKYGDDIVVWSNTVDYFQTSQVKIASIEQGLSSVPANESEFKRSLSTGGIDFDSLRDGWGRPLYIVVERRSRYSDRVTFESTRRFGDDVSTERRVVTPVTQQIIQFNIRSGGPDGKVGTYDDFTLMQVVHVLSERSKDDVEKAPLIKKISFTNASGAIAGRVADSQGAAIPGSTVTATNTVTLVARSVVTDDEGRYVFAGLDAGTYTIKVVKTGFVTSVINSILVASGTTASVDVTLNVAGSTAVVNVAGDADKMVTESTSASVIANKQVASGPVRELDAKAVRGQRSGGAAQDMSTPRLREYFPETLVWQPEIVTDANGKAEVNFKMADSITTWKMYAVASTLNGKVGVGQKEVTAFQAFFADLDPPKFLTAGDEIYLPTQIRNYTGKKQDVAVAMDSAAWFTTLGAAAQRIEVASNSSKNAVFGFRAEIPVANGKQRVTAVGQTESDAIEKPVTVRPYGQEVVRTDSRFWSSGDQNLSVNFPANALPRTQKLELKIFPNLYAHVSDSVEGLLHRPYGCGEQTISSTYPNLMILKFVRSDAAIAKRARNFLQKGYERLLGYQSADGGFTYWGAKDTSDIALTAYAIRFLSDTRSQISIDEDVIARASAWLLK